MQEVIHKAEKYLREVLCLAVAATPWSGPNLPHFLQDRYVFARAQLLGTEVLLVGDASLVEESPAVIRKHLDLLRGKAPAEPIYVRDQVTAYNRKRLIEHRVPFIVPGNQMYLPMVGIDLREHFRRLRDQAPMLSPSTQVLVLHALLGDVQAPLTPLLMAQRLGYTAMTMTRAFDEIEAARLAEVTMHGRERVLRFPAAKRDLWMRAQPLLRNPVAKRTSVRANDDLIPPDRRLSAGLTALAQYSMLAAPPRETYALSREEWKSLRQRHPRLEVPANDPDAWEIEIWTYAPALLARTNLADPLSLYLSLRDQRDDERIEASLDKMIGALQW